MAWFNLIIDFAALALWLNWTRARPGALVQAAPITLTGTLRPATVSNPKRWRFGAALGALLLARVWLYVALSGVINFTPKLRLGFVNIPFRPDVPLHMLVFSLLSFGCTIGAFYLWMLFLSAVNDRSVGANPIESLVRFEVRWVERWPSSLKFACPFLFGAVAWLVLHPLLAWLAVLPQSRSAAQLLAQAAITGLGSYLIWKYLLLAVLLFYLINGHVYLGNVPMWTYADLTARNLLSPFRWLPLRVGRLDLLPLVAMGVVIFLSRLIENPPAGLCQLLPF
jgi:uncharacterized protein YggT (Ycf19 family)